MSIKFVLFVNCLICTWSLYHSQSVRRNYYPDILRIGFDIFNNPRNFDSWISLSDRIQSVTEEIEFISKQLHEYDSERSEWLDLPRLLSIYGMQDDILKECSTFNKYTTNGSVKQIVESECGKGLIANAVFVLNFRRKIEKINEYIGDIVDDYNQLKMKKPRLSPFASSSSELYKLIAGTCEDYSNTTTCFFNEVAGNHLRQIPGNKPFHPTRSIHQELYLIYLKLSTALLKGHVSQMFGYLNEYSTVDAKKVVEILKSEFVVQTSNLAKFIKSAMQVAPREIRPGDPAVHKEGITYFRLKWFVEQFIVNEANLNPTATCSNTCEDYKITTFYEYGNVPSSGNDVCYGVIHRCYTQQLGRLCPPVDPSSRRYGGIEGIQNLGSTLFCSNESRRTDELYYVTPGFFNRCDVCTCLCDDHRNPRTVRTFSLRKVSSDVASNMVITGVRLREIKGIIYIQIQQGVLLKPGVISKSSVHWVPIRTFNITDSDVTPNDYFVLRYLFERTISLNTITTEDEIFQRFSIYPPNQEPPLPDSYVLTGITFAMNQGRINIGVKFTPVLMQTGKLFDDLDVWIINPVSSAGDEIELENSHIPIYGQEENIAVTKNRMALKFGPSDNVKDFGQTTIPYFDSQDVVSDPPMPLTGAGIFYKGQKGYGGFVGLKLISRDFSHFISTDLSQ